MEYATRNGVGLLVDYPYIGKKSEKCYKDEKKVPLVKEGWRL